MKRVARILLATVAALILLLLLAEAAASFTAAGNAATFVEDPDLILQRKPDTEGFTWGGDHWIPCRIGKEGLRGADLPETRTSFETWVLAVGDSFTFGGGVETDEAWPQQLQTLIGPPEASRVRIFNAGANGWDTAWQRLYLEKRGLSQVRPDIVVLGWNWNDLNVDLKAAEAGVRHFIHAEGTWLSAFRDWPRLRDTHLYRWLYCQTMKTARTPTEQQLATMRRSYAATMTELGVEPEQKLAEMRRQRYGETAPELAFWEATDTWQWKQIRKEFTQLAASCSAAGARLVVAMFPEPTWEGPGTFPSVDRLAALLDHLQVPWVDVQPDFLGRSAQGELLGARPELWQRYDPVHPTPAGQELMARRVAELLELSAK
ncbi:MAG: SGNH/GDSL hydrolase family protein [Planctomycetota bacterium]